LCVLRKNEKKTVLGVHLQPCRNTRRSTELYGVITN